MKLLEILVESRVLKTQKGSPIKRSKLGVGKDIGGEIYLHRNYEKDIPDQEGLKKAKAALGKFKYNALKFSKDGTFTFFSSPDFDTADEPVAGKYVKVSPEGKTKESETKNIWHHKWLWVKDDYKGFDVDESFKRSQSWLKLPDVDFNRIGNKDFWEKNVVPMITEGKIAYHGTSLGRAQEIKKTGFSLKNAGEKSNSKLPGISVTVDRNIADEHADWAADKFKDEPSVLKVDLSGLRIMPGKETMKLWGELGSLEKAIAAAKAKFDGAELFDNEDGVEEMEILIFDPKKVKLKP